MFRRCPKRLLKALFSLNLYQVSMEYLIEYMFLSFIVHYDTPHFETYFNTYYNKKLITRNYSELQRPTTIQKKNAKRFATVTQRHKTVEIMSTMTHNNAKQIQTLDKNWSFALKISSVNVRKSATSCGFGHTYRRNT